MISKYPALPASSKRIILVVVVAVVLLIIGGLLSGSDNKSKSSVSSNNSNNSTAVISANVQPIGAKSVRKTNNVLKAVDGDVEFAINPSKIKDNLSSIGKGNDILVAGAGRKFVTVFVQIRNTGNKSVGMRAADQVLITKNGDKIPVSKDLQKYITNGGWIGSISSRGHIGGTLAFDLSADDSVDSIEFRSNRKTAGAKINLK